LHILIINTLYPPQQVGGAEKSVALLAEGLSHTGDKVTVITLHPKTVETCEMLNGVHVYRLPIDNQYWPFTEKRQPAPRRILWHLQDMWNCRAAARVGRILDIEKPDVVHTNNLTGFSAAIWREVKRRNICLVHTMRDYYLVCAKSSLFREGKMCEQRCISCKLMTLGGRLMSSSVDTVVSNSQYTLMAHTSHGYFRNVPARVIFNISEIKQELPKRDMSDPKLIFGFMGLVKQEKGIEVLLRATKKLTKTNWILKIAGVGEESYVAGLKKEFTAPEIEWLGYVRPNDFYRSIDVSIIPSIWAEPLPRTALNTFAAGRSAICADSGGIPEVASMGKKAVVYPANSVSALAEIMNDALNNVQAWRIGGWYNAENAKIFTEEVTLERYRAAYSIGAEYSHDRN